MFSFQMVSNIILCLNYSQENSFWLLSKLVILLSSFIENNDIRNCKVSWKVVFIFALSYFFTGTVYQNFLYLSRLGMYIVINSSRENFRCIVVTTSVFNIYKVFLEAIICLYLEVLNTENFRGIVISEIRKFKVGSF